MGASSYLYFLSDGFLGMLEGLWVWVDEYKGWGHVRLLLEFLGGCKSFGGCVGEAMDSFPIPSATYFGTT